MNAKGTVIKYGDNIDTDVSCFDIDAMLKRVRLSIACPERQSATPAYCSYNIESPFAIIIAAPGASVRL